MSETSHLLIKSVSEKNAFAQCEKFVKNVLVQD